MPIVSAFLVPGSPLPMVHPENPPWGRLAEAMTRAGEALRASKPDVIIVYSTQWIAVLDQLWQTRGRVNGTHVDENWHEFGELPFDIKIDTKLAEACIDNMTAAGIKSRPVDYDQFPIDTGTIVASHFLDPDGDIPMIITSNNLYHDWDMTVSIGGTASATANEAGKRCAIVVIGGLSGSFFRHEIDIQDDCIENADEDAWNKKILTAIESGNASEVATLSPDFAQQAKVDMGFKHFAFLLGALDNKLGTPKVRAYEPVYGAGAAVVEFAVA